MRWHAPGTLLGRYIVVIRSLHQRGGIASVFCAPDLKPEHPVAINRFDRDIPDEPDLLGCPIEIQAREPRLQQATKSLFAHAEPASGTQGLRPSLPPEKGFNMITPISRILVSFTLCALLVQSACNRGTQPPSDPATLSVGYVSTGLTGLAVQVMQDQQLPEKHGLKVNWHGFVDPTSLNGAFVLGKFDVNLAAGASVIALARSQGHDVAYFFPTLLNSTSLLVPQDAPYTTLRDLKGKRVGWYGLASGGGVGFYLIAKRQDVNVLKDLALIQGKPPALMVLLEKGDLDGVLIYEPFVTQLVTTGKFRILVGPFYQEWKQHTGHPLEMAGMAASERWLRTNDGQAKRLVRAWRDAVTHIRLHTRDVLEKYSRFTELSSPAELERGLREIPPVFVSDWGNLETSVNEALTILAKDGALINQVPEGVIHQLKE